MTQENQDTNDRAVPGDNNPPEPIHYNEDRFQHFSDGLDRFNTAAKVWLEIKTVDTAERAEKLNDFLGGAKKLKNQIELQRKADKKPHMDAGVAVDLAYNTLAATLVKVDKAVRPKLDAYMVAEKVKADAIKAEEQRVAREAEEEAQRKLAAAAEDENAAKAAEAAAKTAKKAVKTNVGSATGGGRTAALREYKSAEILVITQVFLHYKDRPEVHDLLKRLADADIRAADVDHSKIPGIKVITAHKSA